MKLSRPVLRLVVALLLVVPLFLVLAESLLRVRTPGGLEALVREHGAVGGRLHPRHELFALDDELGYRPVVGGSEYAPHGAAWNEYALAKPAGVRRLLFLGDSVTRAGRIQAGLRGLLGDQGYEYWNAGVEGYSTCQEVAYYRRYCADIRADRVLLTFHLNDFRTTPITFMDGERMVLLSAKESVREVSPWLMRRSYLYRWFVSWRLGSLDRSGDVVAPGIYREIEDCLRELRDLAAARGAELTVLVLPWLREPQDWPDFMTPLRPWLSSTLTRLGIEHYDLVGTLESALAEGLPLRELGDDPMHPTEEFGARVAQDLLARGFSP